MPDPVQARGRRGRALDALRESEGPQIQQRGASGQGLAHPLQQEDLGRAEQEEAPPVAAIGEQLDGVEQRRLLLHLVEDHEAIAVVKRRTGRCEAQEWICK